MEYPIRNGQRSEGIRNSFNSNNARRGDQNAKSVVTRSTLKNHGDDRATRTGYGLRQNPKATVRFAATTNPTERKIAEKARRIAKEEENSTYGSYSGMATLED